MPKKSPYPLIFQKSLYYALDSEGKPSNAAPSEQNRPSFSQAFVRRWYKGKELGYDSELEGFLKELSKAPEDKRGELIQDGNKRTDWTDDEKEILGTLDNKAPNNQS